MEREQMHFQKVNWLLKNQKNHSDWKSKFTSLTEVLLQMSRCEILYCPECKRNLDLEHGVKWQGPTDLSCNNCNSLINIKSLIQYK